MQPTPSISVPRIQAQVAPAQAVPAQAMPDADDFGTTLLYERWGYLTGQELRDAGNAVADDDLPKVFPANVWVLGNRVIKAMINPMEGVDIPLKGYVKGFDDHVTESKTPLNSVSSA